MSPRIDTKGLRYRNVAARARLRQTAIQAIGLVVPEEVVTWPDLAENLNGRGILSPLGRPWTGRSVSDFVKMHEAMTGRNVAPWMGFSGNRRGWDNIGKARCAFEEKARELRETRAADIRKHCANLTSYEGAVRALDKNGCRAASGRWTVEKLGTFIRGYQAEKGERLTPHVPIRGRGRKGQGEA